MHVERMGIVRRGVGLLLVIPLGIPCLNPYLIEAEEVLFEVEEVGGPGVLEEEESLYLSVMRSLQPPL